MHSNTNGTKKGRKKRRSETLPLTNFDLGAPFLPPSLLRLLHTILKVQLLSQKSILTPLFLLSSVKFNDYFLKKSDENGFLEQCSARQL